MTPHSSVTIEVCVCGRVRARLHSYLCIRFMAPKKCMIFRCDTLISSNYLTAALQLECRKWHVLNAPVLLV